MLLPSTVSCLHFSYYTLRDIIFFLENAEVGVAQYRVNVNAATGVTAVVVADSKDLKGYLTGAWQ